MSFCYQRCLVQTYSYKVNLSKIKGQIHLDIIVDVPNAVTSKYEYNQFSDKDLGRKYEKLQKEITEKYCKRILVLKMLYDGC